MSKALRARLDAAKKTDEFWMDSAKLDFALAVEVKRKELGKSYTDLATALNTSNAYISKIFRGDANLTIDSMVKLARSVDCNINFNLKGFSENSHYNPTPNAATANIKRAFSPETAEQDKINEMKYSSKNVQLIATANDSDYQHAA